MRGSRRALRAAKKQKKRKKIVIKKSWIYAILLVFLVLGLINTPKFIVVRKISCESQYGPCSAPISQALNAAEGKSINASRSLISQTFEKNVFVESYSSKFELPDKLLVSVIERKAEIALVKRDTQDEFFIIDSAGFVISKTRDNQLPVIVTSSPDDFTIGGRVKDDIIFCKDLLRRSFSLFGSKLAFYNGDYLALDLPTGQTVVFPVTGDQDVLFGSLSLILSQLNTGAIDSRIKIIDLRYKNPVLRMQNYEQEQNSSSN